VNENSPGSNFTDEDLKAALRRAMRTILVLGAILFAGFWVAMGWQTAMLLLTGTAISLGSLYEWQRLIAVMNAKLDNQRPPHSTGLVVVMFFLRLGVAGALLYGSLKCFHGSIYALIAGLCLAIISLSIEAIRVQQRV
jgi:hypothetical protein